MNAQSAPRSAGASRSTAHEPERRLLPGRQARQHPAIDDRITTVCRRYSNGRHDPEVAAAAASAPRNSSDSLGARSHDSSVGCTTSSTRDPDLHRGKAHLRSSHPMPLPSVARRSRSARTVRPVTKPTPGSRSRTGPRSWPAGASDQRPGIISIAFICERSTTIPSSQHPWSDGRVHAPPPTMRTGELGPRLARRVHRATPSSTHRHRGQSRPTVRKNVPRPYLAVVRSPSSPGCSSTPLIGRRSSNCQGEYVRSMRSIVDRDPGRPHDQPGRFW